MKKEKLFFFDTTLRDGGQMHGIDFSLADKIFISEAIDEFYWCLFYSSKKIYEKG